jgi:transglutaminase-like putative cysteine protease
MSDGRQFGEAVLVIAAIVALLLSAAFLPVVDVFGDGSGPGVIGFSDGELEGSGLGGGDRDGEMPSGTPGSPVGGSLAAPEQTSISGGFDGEIDSVPLFVVDSPEDTYWRQTAYTSYTGTSWEQSTDDQPISEGVPNDDRTVDSRTVDYEVTVLTSTRSLPTAWQPKSVSLSNQSGTTVRASTVGSVSTDRSISKGTTYSAESSPPPRDATTLRRADGQAPAEIRRTYTQLPADTPDRVGEHTAEIVDGEQTRYDRVTAVKNWLKSNNGYSLQTDIDPNEPIADQLIFEVDEAYCQHFATTMAAMLRSQDIPARYVVGFSGGQSVGDDEYLVTSDRAHAWVEVYFESVGWVRFDPTPGGDLPVNSPQPPYDLSLNRSAVVGADVTVSVDKNDSAVVGVPVYVNDERVGWTDAGGKATTTLPYAEEVTITARPRGSETKYDDDSRSTTTVADLDGSVSTPLAADLSDVSSTVKPRLAGVLSTVAGSLPLPIYRLGGPTVDTLSSGVLQAGDGNEESSVTYTSETNATISVGGNRTTGGTAQVVVTVRDVPVADASINFDGETVGSTDTDGVYELSLSDIEPGNYSVRATRGPVDASSTLAVSPSEDDSETGENEERDPLAPNISVSPSLIALPGTTATTTVSRDGQPISGTAVRVDGKIVGETDADGTVGFSFPIADSVVVAASANGVTGEQSVEGLYRNAGGLVAVLVGVLVGLGVLARRYGITRQLLTRKLAAVVSIIISIPHRLTNLVIRLATSFEAAIAGLWRRLRLLPSLLSGSLADVIRRLSPRRLLLAAVAWVRARLRGLRRSDADTAANATGTGSAETEEHRRVRAIWGSFVEFVRPPKLSTRTPGEIGRYAIDRGLPRRPVEYITELYRAAEYGRRSPNDSRLESAREALSTVREEDDE